MEGSINNDKTSWSWALWHRHQQIPCATEVPYSNKTKLSHSRNNEYTEVPGTLSLSVGDNYTYTDD